MICKSEGARLATVYSDATFDYITRLYNQSKIKHLWLGGRDVNSKGMWKWANGDQVNKTYWNYGEPNNHNGIQEDCIGLLNPNGRWFDLPCGWYGPYFLCQKGKWCYQLTVS